MCFVIYLGSSEPFQPDSFPCGAGQVELRPVSDDSILEIVDRPFAGELRTDGGNCCCSFMHTPSVSKDMSDEERVEDRAGEAERHQRMRALHGLLDKHRAGVTLATCWEGWQDCVITDRGTFERRAVGEMVFDDQPHAPQRYTLV